MPNRPRQWHPSIGGSKLPNEPEITNGGGRHWESPCYSGFYRPNPRNPGPAASEVPLGSVQSVRRHLAHRPNELETPHPDPRSDLPNEPEETTDLATRGACRLCKWPNEPEERCLVLVASRLSNSRTNPRCHFIAQIVADVVSLVTFSRQRCRSTPFRQWTTIARSQATAHVRSDIVRTTNTESSNFLRVRMPVFVAWACTHARACRAVTPARARVLAHATGDSSRLFGYCTSSA